MSLREESKRRKDSIAMSVVQPNSARPLSAHTPAHQRSRFEKELLQRQEAEAWVEQQKMAALLVEGRKTAITPIHIDSRLDGTAMSRSMVYWMEEHDLEHLLPL